MPLFRDGYVPIGSLWLDLCSRLHGTLYLGVAGPGRVAQHAAGCCAEIHGSVLVWWWPGQHLHGAAGITTGSSSGSPSPPRGEESLHLSEEKTTEY